MRDKIADAVFPFMAVAGVMAMLSLAGFVGYLVATALRIE